MLSLFGKKKRPEFAPNELLVSKEDQAKCEQLAKDLLRVAAEEEALVTEALQELAAEHGVSLHGLGHRFKAYPSLYRKILSTLEWKRGQVLSFHKPSKGSTDSEDGSSGGQGNNDGTLVDAESVVKTYINDALRYTMIVPVEAYVAVVEKVQAQLEERHMKLTKSNNFWEDGDHYQGLNQAYSTPSGRVRFELQFHTPVGVKVKAKCHKLYEVYRVEKTFKKKKKLFDKGVALARTVPVPANVLSIPTVLKPAPPSPIQTVLETDLVSARIHMPEISARVAGVCAEYVTDTQGMVLATMYSLQADVEDWMIEHKSKNVEKAVAAAVRDTIHINLCIPPEQYVPTIHKLLKEIPGSVGAGKKQRKHSHVATLNYWGKGDAYNGIHLQFVMNGRDVKVQYEIRLHTPETWALFQDDTQNLVNKFASMSPEETHTAYKALVSKWDASQKPDGVMDIGEHEEFELDDIIAEAK